MEKLVTYNGEMVTLQSISFEERMNFIEELSNIEKEKDLNDIEKTKKLYSLNFGMLEKLSRGKIRATDLYKQDAEVVDNLVQDLQQALTSSIQKKN